MSFWNSLRIASSALSAQRLRLDIISNNIANAETTRTAEGGPYQRQDVVFSPQGSDPMTPQFLNVLRSFRGGNAALPLSGVAGVKVSKIVTDNSAGPRVYDPSHPDADEEGYVNYPNVNLVVEMTNMLSATRSYEAGLAVVDASKRMAQKALEIGR
ncbi:MAG: flagellar basal body rod protein FlgC [Anaerolineales bacterium]